MTVIQGHYHSRACTLAVFRAEHNNIEIPYFVIISNPSLYSITLITVFDQPAIIPSKCLSAFDVELAVARYLAVGR